MGTLKKYNPETEQWETWASGSASGIYSVNPNLFTEENQEYITVDEALQRDREDIEELQKNVAWVAIHGAYGTGGGGGTEATISVDILDDNGAVTNTIPWRPTSRAIRYRINSSRASNRFLVSITLDNKIISNATVQVPPGIYTINVASYIKENTTTTKHTINIQVTDSYENQASTSASINEINITLQAALTGNRLSATEVETSTIQINYYSTDVPKDYTLYYGTDSRIGTNPSEYCNGSTTFNIARPITNQISIRYYDIEHLNQSLFDSPNVVIGSTVTCYFVLVQNDDPTIKSSVLVVPVVITSATSAAIQHLTLSSDINNPTIIPQTNTLNFAFITYFDSALRTYTYMIEARKLHIITPAEVDQEGMIITPAEWEIIDESDAHIIPSDNSGVYNQSESILYTGFNTDAFFEVGETYEIRVSVANPVISGNYFVGSAYIRVAEASGTQIPLDADDTKIFDFKVWGNPDSGNNWTSTNTEFIKNNERSTVYTDVSLYNIGGKSGKTINSWRLTNKAYGVINRSTINGNSIKWFPANDSDSNNALISASSPQFTLSLSFYNDFTPNDERTIFNFGNYIPETADNPIATGNGILINNHNYYIQFGNKGPLITGKLQDSIFHQFDIVFGRDNFSSSGNTKVEVYHNGVLLNYSFGNNSIYDLSVFNEMSFACYKNGNELSQYTNINLQTISFYAIALNPYQIVCNYINNLVTYDLDESYGLNTELLRNKLKSNLIVFDDVNRTYSCALWNGESYTDNWASVDSSNRLTVNQNLADAAGELPIVMLDFSNNSHWTWEAFRNNWATTPISDAEDVKFYYIVDNSDRGAGMTVTVQKQGTSSLAYSSKNLEIVFNDSMFWPKNTWFPEREFTLKADVVDSAHANNACVGKFINNCSSNTSIVTKTPPMEYFDLNKNNFELPESSNLSIKHTLEGFPVLLIARFASTVQGVVDIRSLGIYSFNLGRSSEFNTGFKVLKQFRDTSGEIATNISAPCVLSLPQDTDVVDFLAQSWEGMESYRCSEKNQDVLDELDEHGASIDCVNKLAPVKLNGYFWSDDPEYIAHFWKQVYGANTNITRFRNLCSQLVSATYTKGDFIISDQARFWVYNYSASRGYYIPDDAIERSAGRTIPNLNLTNAQFYYIICMLFGLTDSLGKNLTMRYWGYNYQNTENYIPIWYTCFYDMDTALGLSNLGEESVNADCFDLELVNEASDLRTRFASSSNIDEHKIYTIPDNKLWGILDNFDFKKEVIGQGGDVLARNSVYAGMWSNLRANVLQDIDAFMEDYFYGQVETVGELLYNQDFDVKYLQGSTADVTFMHGDRKAFVADWIRKRVKFLDSMFGYIQASSASESQMNGYLESSAIQDKSYNQTVVIAHNSGALTLPVVTNSPIVLKTSLGNTHHYTYVPNNTPTNVTFAVSLNSTNIQTSINNTDTILEIRNLSSLGVISLNPQAIGSGTSLYNKQIGAFSAFSDFNMSGNTSFTDNAINFLELFKTWNEGSATRPYSLTNLDLSNTKDSRGRLTVVLSGEDGPNGETYYSNPFENLTDINLQNSCASSISLPASVALFNLLVSNSALRSIELIGQTILNNVDFSGCTALQSIELTDCSAYTELNLTGLPSLNNIFVNNCQNLNNISIDMNTSKNNMTINIENMSNLKTFSLKNCLGSNTSLVLSGASQLEELTLTNCTFEHLILSPDCKTTLRKLDLSNSRIKHIQFEGATINLNGNLIDLQGFNVLTDFNIANNPAVEYIQFNNIENSPVVLTKPFTSCISLKRVYGNIVISLPSVDNTEKNGIFAGCSNFSILGSDLSLATFDGESALVSGTTKVRHFTDEATSEDAINFHWVSGTEVTNLTFGNTFAQYGFYQSNCTLFDAYYILWNIGAAQELISAFSNCNNLIMSCTSTVDNSPHWTMFNKCGNVTKVEGLFYSGGSNKFRIYTPCNEHQGLYTPLISCTTIASMWWSKSYITDRNVFRRSDARNYKITNMNFFSPILLVNDVNNLTPAEVLQRCNAPTDYIGTPGNFIAGDLTEFFTNLPLLSSTIYGIFGNTTFIDYTTFSPIPSSVITVRSCFISSFAYGIIGDTDGVSKLNNLFLNASRIKNLWQSFIVGGNGTYTEQTLSATLNITDETLRGFTNLEQFGYVTGSTWPGSQSKSSFTGTYLKKVIIGNTFPYRILTNAGCASKIVQFLGFFRGAEFENPITAFDILENENHEKLFNNCVNLQDISYLFYDFRNPYKLSSDQFVGTKLKQVERTFGASNSDENVNNLTGSIPQRLFNLGFTESIQSFTGTQEESRALNNISGTFTREGNGVRVVNPTGSEIRTITVLDENEQEIETTVEIFKRDYDLYTDADINPEDDTQLIVTPLTKYIHSTQETLPTNSSSWKTLTTTEATYLINNWTTSSISYTVKTPITTITNMSGCFAGINTNVYNNTTPTIEVNPTFCPYKYINVNGEWTAANEDLYNCTYMWEFDGQNYLDLSNVTTISNITSMFDTQDYSISINCKSLDEFSESDVTNVTAWCQPLYGLEVTPVLNFFAPPDLFRWCTTSAIITGIFEYSGQNNNGATQYTNHSNIPNYGMRGRICPYLLSPLKDLTSIANMFMFCTNLYSYVIDGRSYLIPKTFLTYTPALWNLSYAFQGCSFGKDPQFEEVFNKLSTPLNVKGIFKRALFAEGTAADRSKIRNVFKTNNISEASEAFAISGTQPTPDQSRSWIWDQYIQFIDIFKPSAYTNRTWKYVFDGYREGHCIHESPKTMNPGENYYNYRFY